MKLKNDNFSHLFYFVFSRYSRGQKFKKVTALNLESGLNSSQNSLSGTRCQSLLQHPMNSKQKVVCDSALPHLTCLATTLYLFHEEKESTDRINQKLRNMEYMIKDMMRKVYKEKQYKRNRAMDLTAIDARLTLLERSVAKLRLTYLSFPPCIYICIVDPWV